MTDDPGPLQRQLAEMCADDLLVFQRVGSSAWLLIGGVGHGADWAGVVEVGDVPSLAVGERRAVVHGSSRQVIGPYHAAEALLVRVRDDRLVVVGRRTGRLHDRATETCGRLAAEAVELVEEVSPAKRLADEIAVLRAVQDCIAIDTGRRVSQVLADLAEVVTAALACEVAVIHLPESGVRVSGTTDTRAAAHFAERVLDTADVQRCVQEASGDPLALHDVEVRSWLATPLPGMPGAGIVAAHTAADPRGFSETCQDLASRLAETAATVIATATSRAQAIVEAEAARVAAERDPLTGLGNRASWERAVDEAERSIAAGKSCGVLVIDMDGLKDVNDEYGHEAGDAMLRSLAWVLRSACPDDDVVRLGGDEFAILVAGPHADVAVRERRDLLLDRLARTDGPMRLSASIGACSTAPGEDIRSCVRRADRKMYAQKAARGPRRRRADPGDRQLDQSLRTMLEAGGQTDEHGSLSFVLQPVVRMPDATMTGVEALARWTHPSLGPIPPGVFVQAAERMGMVDTLDHLVLRIAAAEAARLQASYAGLRLSVNVSARGLRADLADRVAGVLDATGLPADLLQLELTHAANGCAPDEAVRCLEPVRAIGVGVALDDLGGGLPALSRLGALPLTQAKIDGAQLEAAARSRKARKVLDGLVALLHALELTVTVEGVENEAESRIVAASGSDYAQGFLYGTPQPARSFGESHAGPHIVSPPEPGDRSDAAAEVDGAVGAELRQRVL